jgi:hypothetical protein
MLQMKSFHRPDYNREMGAQPRQRDVRALEDQKEYPKVQFGYFNGTEKFLPEGFEKAGRLKTRELKGSIEKICRGLIKGQSQGYS